MATSGKLVVYFSTHICISIPSRGQPYIRRRLAFDVPSIIFIWVLNILSSLKQITQITQVNLIHIVNHVAIAMKTWQLQEEKLLILFPIYWLYFEIYIFLFHLSRHFAVIASVEIPVNVEAR